MIIRGSLSKSPDYETIKQHLSKVSKSMYKTSLKYDPILLLEKSMITGRAFERKEARPKRREKISPDPLTLSLKPEHKNSSGVKIYQLPKLPFGVHKTYNEESEFSSTHFTINGCSEELSKNLDILTRKFRLKEKNLKKNLRGANFNAQRRKKAQVNSIKLKSGLFVFPKEKSVTEMYERAKAAYKEESHSMDKERKSQSLERKKMEKSIVERLYPVRENTESPTERFYKTKYSPLFTEEAQVSRPETNMLPKSWKNLVSP